MVRAICIDSLSLVPVVEINFNVNGGLQPYYDMLSDRRLGIEVDTFQCLPLPNGDTLYIDEEGLFRDTARTWTLNTNDFMLNYPELVGRGIILGTGDEDAAECKTTLVQAASWLRLDV